MANSGDQAACAATETHFAKCFRDFDLVVGSSGSCVPHVRFHLDACEQTPKVIYARGAVRELTEFLHDDLKVERFPEAVFLHKVGVHDSCTTIRELRQARPSELANVPFFSQKPGSGRKGTWRDAGSG